jgi:uncharacterized membrane protein
MLKKYFMTGLLVWVPIGVTVILIKWLLAFMDQWMHLLPHAYQPGNWLGFDVPGVGLVLALALITLTGMLMANVLGRWFLHLSEQILHRIPLVRSIYKGVKQSMTVLFSSQGGSFRQVVLIEYPRRDLWSLGFITQHVPEVIGNTLHPDMVMVFVPTTPNPTSGFLIMAKNDEVRRLDMQVDEALKCIISLGTAVGINPSDYKTKKTEKDAAHE